MTFSAFCAQAFSFMETNLRSRSEIVFWSAGLAIPPLLVQECSPENGIWYATGTLANGRCIGMSVMLIPGELRVGTIIPRCVIDTGNDDVLVALSPDGNPHDALREVVGGYLYDRSFQDDPFTPGWIVDAYQNEAKAEATALTMASLVASAYKAAFDVISRHNEQGLTHSLMLVDKDLLPLQAISAKTPVVITESLHTKALGYIAMVNSTLSATELERALRELGYSSISVMGHEEIVSVPSPSTQRAVAAVR